MVISLSSHFAHTIMLRPTKVQVSQVTKPWHKINPDQKLVVAKIQLWQKIYPDQKSILTCTLHVNTTLLACSLHANTTIYACTLHVNTTLSACTLQVNTTLSACTLHAEKDKWKIPYLPIQVEQYRLKVSHSQRQTDHSKIKLLNSSLAIVRVELSSMEINLDVLGTWTFENKTGITAGWCHVSPPMEALGGKVSYLLS